MWLSHAHLAQAQINAAALVDAWLHAHASLQARRPAGLACLPPARHWCVCPLCGQVERELVGGKDKRRSDHGGRDGAGGLGRQGIGATARAGVSCGLQITSENSAFSLSSLFVGPRRKRKYIITRDESPRYPFCVRTCRQWTQSAGGRFSGKGGDRRAGLRGCTAHRFRIGPRLHCAAHGA